MKHVKTTVKFSALSALSTLLCLSAAVQAQGIGPSALDLSFNGSGRNTHKISNNGGSIASCVAIQSDGKIVAAGSSNNSDFGVARYNTNGQLDSSFGSGGKVSTDMGGADYVRALAIQGDGKIVVVGNKGDQFAVARYNTNGSLDSSFDGDGKRAYSLGASLQVATSVAIQSDGKIVIAGSNISSGIVTRLTSSGAFDTSFGVGGSMSLQRNAVESFSSVAIQSDGKILAAGRYDVPLPYSTSLSVRRLNSNGSVDTSFGQTGLVIFSGISAATGMLVHPDGRIVVCGNNGERFAAVRLLSNGSIDQGFGSPYGYLGGAPNGQGGPVVIAPGTVVVPGRCTSISSDAQGRYILGGYADNGNGTFSFRIARSTAAGTKDSGFNNNIDYVDTYFGSQNEGAFGVAVQSDGKIVAVGQSNDKFATARYLGGGIVSSSVKLSSPSGNSS